MNTKYNKSEYINLLELVSNAMINLKNDSFEEKYPIGLINMNLWEWPQGVGLYGQYKYYLNSRKPEVLKFLCDWFDARISEGLPEKNVNTMAPMLTLVGVYEITKDEKYGELCKEWSSWIINDMLRTGESLFQHMITGDPNDGQILIDTLFMTCLFLAKAGAVFNILEYQEESKRQFLAHIKYLYDIKTGLYFHGFDFNGMHHYGAVHWGRGNAWYTCGIVDFIDMIPMDNGLRQFYIDTLSTQVKALEKYQTQSGMWRTIIDDESSYEETSATAGFAYGILKAVRLGYIHQKYKSIGINALNAVINNIDKDGVVQNVSYGTPVGNDAKFYKDIEISPMTYGQALVLLLLSEALEL